MHFDSGLTRRALLRAGAGAGAAMAIGVRPWAAAAVPAAAAGYLTRSAYAGLEGTSFTVETGADPVVLRLESVADVAGAATRRSLAGSEECFALTFSGPLSAPLDSGIHTLSHPSLGSFELFASPVDQPEAKRTYEIVVDRSVPEDAARRATAQPAKHRLRFPPRTRRPRPRATAARVRPTRPRATVRRSVDAEHVRCRLFGNGRLAARAGGEVADGRAVVRLEADHALTAAAYTLVVTAIHADGSRSSERRRVGVR